jgi:hypothetical protein
MIETHNLSNSGNTDSEYAQLRFLFIKAVELK